jgi:hypothetical protein
MGGVSMAETGMPRGSTKDQEVLSWLTLERAAYGGACVLALAFRLLLLGARPLGPAEAMQALPALFASAGREFNLIGTSPLLFGMQRLLFSLFGASDSWARAWPALLGGLAPLLFLGLSRCLGRGGALVAAYLWAVSPMAVFTSRLGLGYALVPDFALAVISCVTWGLDRDASAATRRLALTIAAGTTGLLLASGQGAYTVLLMVAPALLIWRRSVGTLGGMLRSCWKQAAGAFLLSFALGSSFFFMAPDGLAAAADVLGSWIAALRPGVGEYPAWELGLRLVLSEPVLLVFGLAGIVFALVRKDRFGIFASVFAGLALLLLLNGSARHPADLGLVILALAFLAGPVIAHVILRAWSCRRELDAWLLVTVSTVLLVSAGLCLPGIFNPANNSSWRQLYAVVGIVTIALAGLLWLVYGMWGNWRTVALAAPFVPLLFGLVWGLGQVNAINYDRGAWRQSGVLHEAPAPGWHDLQAEVLDLASLHGRGKGEGDIDLTLPPAEREALEPQLRWTLRMYPNVRLVSGVSAAAAPVVIAPPGEQPRLSSRYSGTEIAILQRWEPSALTDFYSRLRWVLYRESTQPPASRNIVLWMERPELPASEEGEDPLFGGAQSQSGVMEQ